MNESRVQISKRLILFNSASSVLSRLLNVSVLFWMYRYLLDRIPPEEFAIYPVAAAIMTFAPLLSSVLTGGISRYIVDAYARGENEEMREIHSSCVFPLWALCLGGFAFGTLFALNIEHIVRVPESQYVVARRMMFLLIVNFFVQTAVMPYTVGFDVHQKFAQREAIGVVRELIRMAILLVLLVGVSPNVLWIVVATVVSNLSALVVIVYVSRKLVPELRFAFGHVRRSTSLMLISFGFWTTVGQLSLMIYRSGGAIVLNALGTPLDVTNYHLGATIDRQVMSFSTMASAPIQPALTAMNSTGDTTRLGNAYLRGGRYALWAVLFVACPLGVYSREFVQLYVGEKYDDAALVIILLLASYPFLYSQTLLPKLALAKARNRPYAIGALITSLCIVAAMVMSTGIMHAGSLGIASSVFAGCVLSRLLFFWPLGFRLAEVSLSRFLNEAFLPGLLPSVAAFPFWIALKYGMSPNSWLALIGCSLAGQAVYVLTIYAVCLRESERADVSRLFRSVQSRMSL